MVLAMILYFSMNLLIELFRNDNDEKIKFLMGIALRKVANYKGDL